MIFINLVFNLILTVQFYIIYIYIRYLQHYIQKQNVLNLCENDWYEVKLKKAKIYYVTNLLCIKLQLR